MFFFPNFLFVFLMFFMFELVFELGYINNIICLPLFHYIMEKMPICLCNKMFLGNHVLVIIQHGLYFVC